MPTSNFTMRLKPSLHAELKQAAADAETSITAEAERRLEQPVVSELARLVDLAVQRVEQRTGATWRTDELTALRVKYALETLFAMVLGDFVPVAELKAKWSSEVARIMPKLEQRIDGKIKPTPEEKDETIQMTRLGDLLVRIAEDSSETASLAEGVMK